MATPSHWLIAVGHIGSTIATGIGLWVVSGHMIGTDRPGWFGNPIPMAFETSVVSILLGASVFALASALDRHVKRCHPKNSQD